MHLIGPTEASFVVEVWIREMKITMELPIVKVYSHGMMGVLINSPHETCQIQAWIESAYNS